MTTLVKISIGAGVIGLLTYLYKKGTELANTFGFEMKGYDTPSLSWPNLDLPVKVEFNNPTSVPVNLDNVTGAIYIQKGSWQNVANFSQPVSIPPGKNIVKIKTRIDLSKIFGGSVWDTISAAVTAMNTKVLNVRTDLTVTFKGVSLPTKQFINQVQIG